MFDSAFWIGAAMALALALGLGQKHPIARIGLWSLAAFWPSFGPRATSRAGMGRLASRGLPPVGGQTSQRELGAGELLGFGGPKLELVLRGV